MSLKKTARDRDKNIATANALQSARMRPGGAVPHP